MDYNLRRLGERGFEQLIQALAIAELGSNVQIFGSGPDGGREAAFNGLDYRDVETGKRWNGFGVVQAKFVDVSESEPDLGYRRFRRSFKSELHDWAKPESKRDRTPDFLLLATNAALSPVPKTGGLAKFHNDMNADVLASGVKIKGWDVWHYAKICALLDTHAGVRNAYLGAVAPGDILAAMFETYTEHAVVAHNAMLASLMSDFSEEETMRLGEIGESESASLPLSKIFLEVPAHRNTEPENSLDLTESLIREYDRITRQHDPSGFSARVVVVGGPGQGKTTVGRFVAQMYRRSLLLDSGPGVTSMTAKQTLNEVSTAVARLGLASPVNRRWPFRIVLSEYASSIKSGIDDLSLTKYILDDFNRHSDLKITSSGLSAWLRSWPILLILDGMDEVPLSLRPDVVKQVDRFTDSISVANGDLALLVTTRPQGEGTDFSPSKFDHWRMELLTSSLGLAYAKHLAALRFGNGGRTLEGFHDTIAEAMKNSNTERLMRTPLQVAIMTLLLERRSRIPESRAALFEEYFRTIYTREEAKPNFGGEIFQTQRPLIEGIIERAALLLQLRSEFNETTTARLSDEELEALIADSLRDAETPGNATVLAKNIRAAISDRLVILVSRTEGYWEFEVRSLQEFMVARALTSGDLDSDEARRVLEITASSIFWRNVWLFAAGRIYSEKRHLRDSIILIVTTLNLASPLSAAIRPAASLSMDLLADHVMDTYPKHQKLLIPLAIDVCLVSGGSKIADLAHLIVDSQTDDSVYPITLRALAEVEAHSSSWTQTRHLFNVLRHTKGKLQGVGERFALKHELDLTVDESERISMQSDIASAFSTMQRLGTSITGSTGFKKFAMMAEEYGWEGDPVAGIETVALFELSTLIENPAIATDFAEIIRAMDLATDEGSQHLLWMFNTAEEMILRAPAISASTRTYLRLDA